MSQKSELQAPRVVCLGLVGREEVRSPQRSGEGWGGAALYFGAAASIIGADVTIVTALDANGESQIRADLQRLRSALAIESAEASVASRFALEYGPELKLDRFWYEPGSLGSEDATIAAAIASFLDHAQHEDEQVHVHICPLPPRLMKAIADPVLELDINFSVQAHFSEVESSRRELQRLIAHAEYVFMNKDEALGILDVASDDDIANGILGVAGGTTFITDSSGVRVLSHDVNCRFDASNVRAVDPTGGGDSFAGATLSRRLTGATLDDSVNTGLALAALTVCSFSSDGLLQLLQQPAHS